MCTYLQNVLVFSGAAECLRTRSLHFFGAFFGVVVGGDISEPHVLLCFLLLVAHLSLHMEADHQLVDHHTDDGAEERGEDGHQEPAVSSPEGATKNLVFFVFILQESWNKDNESNKSL